MTKNMGNMDRLFRALVAITIFVAWYAGVIGSTLAIVLGVFATVFIVTSLISFCPLYRPFGISTCGKR